MNHTAWGTYNPLMLILVGIGLILWLSSVVHIAKRRTEDPFDRIAWLMVVLALNFVGTLLYAFFASKLLKDDTSTRTPEEEIKRRANEEGL